jgi:hypothetical protein
MASTNERREIMRVDGRVVLPAGSNPLRRTQDTPNRDALTGDPIRARLADGFSPPAQKPNPT